MLKKTVCFLLSALSLFTTFYAVGKFVIFVSNPTEVVEKNVPVNQLWKNNSLMKSTCRKLFMNVIWTILFILQHSLMKSEAIKEFWKKLQLSILERTIYNLFSSYFLLILMHKWQPINSVTLWNFPAERFTSVWYVFVLVHVACWLIIVCGSLLMDLPETLGIKQIYYDFKQLNAPSSYKTSELNRLLNNIRHPSFIGFSMLFWFINCMSLDRLILATLLTIYMFVAWNPKQRDYYYQKQQLERKKLELAYSLH